jgi:hypothetical protein
MLNFRAKSDDIEFLARRIDYTVQYSHLLSMGTCFGNSTNDVPDDMERKRQGSRLTLISYSRKAITCLELDLP